MSLGLSEIIIGMMGIVTFIIVIWALRNYMRVGRKLKGGRGWFMYQFAIGAYLVGLLTYLLFQIRISSPFLTRIIGGVSSSVGAVILIYAFTEIYSAIKRA